VVELPSIELVDDASDSMDEAVMAREDTVTMCSEVERKSRMWSGRVCVSVAVYRCSRCNRPTCGAHTRLSVDGEEARCETCAASHRTGRTERNASGL